MHSNVFFALQVKFWCTIPRRIESRAGHRVADSALGGYTSPGPSQDFNKKERLTPTSTRSTRASGVPSPRRKMKPTRVYTLLDCSNLHRRRSAAHLHQRRLRQRHSAERPGGSAVSVARVRAARTAHTCGSATRRPRQHVRLGGLIVRNIDLFVCDPATSTTTRSSGVPSPRSKMRRLESKGAGFIDAA